MPRPRLDPPTVRELAGALEEELARLDARSARCSMCRDAEAQEDGARIERADREKLPQGGYEGPR